MHSSPPAVTSAEYLLGPLLVIALIGGLILILRWAFSRGGSLVRRTDSAPAPPDTFGLLTEVHTSSAFADARRIVELLTNERIKATAARTTKGWTVYVWPADVEAAKDLIRSTQA